MKKQTLTLMAVGIASSVIAWAITTGVNKLMNNQRGYSERDRSGRNRSRVDDRMQIMNRRNKILAGIGGGGVIA